MRWATTIAVSLERPPEEVFVPGARHEPAGAAQYVNAIYGPQVYAERETVPLDLCPDEGLVCVGAYDGAVVLSDRNLFYEIGSDLPERVVAALPGPTCCLLLRPAGHSMIFRLYRDGRQVREVLIVESSGESAATESGDRLPEEEPYWRHAPPPVDGEVFPLPFHAEDFALEMMRAYAFGQRPDQRGNDLMALPVQQFTFVDTGRRLATFLRRWHVR
jgi:hypothetical protein